MHRRRFGTAAMETAVALPLLVILKVIILMTDFCPAHSRQCILRSGSQNDHSRHDPATVLHADEGMRTGQRSQYPAAMPSLRDSLAPK